MQCVECSAPVQQTASKLLLHQGRFGVSGKLTLGRCCTGPHVDGKNVEGSYSALVVAELGDPVAGGFYMLPQVPPVSQPHKDTGPMTPLASAGTQETHAHLCRARPGSWSLV